MDNCGSGTTIQALGIGPNVDKDLIRRCALNGRGNSYFIENYEETEAKLVESVAKTRLEYLLIKELTIMDEDNEPLYKMICEPPCILQPGAIFECTKLIVG